MRQPKYLQHILLGATAVIVAGASIATGNGTPAENVAATASIMPGVAEAASIASVGKSTTYLTRAVNRSNSTLAARTRQALDAFAPTVRRLSHGSALEDAFSSYFAYKAANPGQVRKPFLYFVDYGLPNTTPRGYVFDMEQLRLVDGPFMVAAGRGSRESAGVPTRFSNVHGSAATSLGLYLAQETYGFSGKAGGRRYTSIGLRLKGLSRGFNDNARARGVVAHGAPYVTPSRAGRSEGCPAVEERLARTLLPKLANGGMVFLFAPDQRWMSSDPWVAAAKNLAANDVADAATQGAN